MKEDSRLSPLVSLSIALLLSCLATSYLPAQSAPPTAKPASPWITNFQDARETATADKKDLAILFTASDWLDLAQTFDKKILNQEAFLKSAIPNYTLLRLNFPKDARIQPNQITTQNQLLMRAYRVRGFPTLILTDSLGRPYAITGYHEGGLTSWVNEFNQLRLTREKRDRLFAQAKQVEGVQRAKLLTQALPELPGNITARFYRNILDEIIKLDPDNQTGQIGHFKLLIADVNYVDQMQKLTISGDNVKMLELSDQYLAIAKLEGDQRQSVLFNKLGIYERQGRKDEVERTLREIIATDPKSPQGKQATLLLKKVGSAPNKKN